MDVTNDTRPAPRYGAIRRLFGVLLTALLTSTFLIVLAPTQAQAATAWVPEQPLLPCASRHPCALMRCRMVRGRVCDLRHWYRRSQTDAARAHDRKPDNADPQGTHSSETGCHNVDTRGGIAFACAVACLRDSLLDPRRLLRRELARSGTPTFPFIICQKTGRAGAGTLCK